MISDVKMVLHFEEVSNILDFSGIIQEFYSLDLSNFVNISHFTLILSTSFGSSWLFPDISGQLSIFLTLVRITVHHID